MATRGARPKSAALRLVDGTHRADRHGDEGAAESLVAHAAEAFGALVRPKYLTGEARKAWEKWIAPASWLDGSKEASAIAFCELWKLFRAHPERFPAAYHGQLRAYMSELGLTDERNRVVSDKGEKDPASEFLD